MTPASEFRTVAERVLDQLKRPMSAKEIVDYALERKLFSDRLAGKTPAQTMKAKLSVDIRRKGKDSMFVRTAPGRFYLRRLLEPEDAPYEAKPLRPPPSAERVLVFPADWLREYGSFQGIATEWEPHYNSLLGSGMCSVMDRLAAEDTEECKQVLTYIMVTRGDQMLAFERGTFNRVADFLRGRTCVGFGGHVSEVDWELWSLEDYGVLRSAARELAEEIDLPAVDRERLERREGLQVVGLLNDDSSAVGRRHFAIVLRYEVSDDPAWDQPQRGEKSITRLRWIDPSAGGFRFRDLEYWSQLCLRTFFPKALHVAASYGIRRVRPLRPPHLLCVLGPIGSGKTETAALLVRDYGYVEINSGRVVAEVLGLPPVTERDRAAFQEAAWSFIQRPDGPARLAAAMLEAGSTTENDRVLVEGVRQRRTLEALQHAAGEARIGKLFVYTPPDLAFEFYKARAGDEPVTFNDFIARRESAVEQEADGLIAEADAVLYNWVGREGHQTAVRDLMAELGIEPRVKKAPTGATGRVAATR